MLPGKNESENLSALKESQRAFGADLLKVVSIIAVLFIHSAILIPFSPSRFDLKDPNTWIQVATHLLRVCVPVFVFLFSYFLEKSILKRGTKSIRRRFIKLFVPFICWSTIYFLIIADFKNLSITAAITKYWSGYGWAGQYYFVILFQIMALFVFVRKISSLLINHVSMVYLFSIIMFLIASYSKIFDISIIEKIGERGIIYWLPYAILGIIHAHKDIFRYPSKYFFFLLIIFMPIEVFYLHLGTLRPYLTTTVFLSSMLLITWLIDVKSLTIKNSWISNCINYIANNTLGIFCINPLIVITADPIMKSLNLHLQFPGCTIITPIISTLFVLVICLIIIKLLKILKLGFLVSN